MTDSDTFVLVVAGPTAAWNGHSSLALRGVVYSRDGFFGGNIHGHLVRGCDRHSRSVQTRVSISTERSIILSPGFTRYLPYLSLSHDD